MFNEIKNKKDRIKVDKSQDQREREKTLKHTTNQVRRSQ